MSDEFFSEVSELIPSVYYDRSNGNVVAWFHNENVDKADIVAYLAPNMKWDVRRVVSERSVIKSSSEEVIIEHELLGAAESGSDFDTLIKRAVDVHIENGKNVPESITRAKEILDAESYGNVLDGKMD